MSMFSPIPLCEPNQPDPQQIISLLLANQTLAICRQAVQEIVKPGDVTAPAGNGNPSFGYMRLRRMQIPVINLRHWLRLPAQQPMPPRGLVVIGTGQNIVGLLVDEVDAIARSIIEPVDRLTGCAIPAGLLLGSCCVAEKRLAVLDPAPILDSVYPPQVVAA